MYLFICKNYKNLGTTDELVCRALEIYCSETGLETAGLSRKIVRTEKGKPYFEELPVQFSVSHTDDIWVCAFTGGSEPVGVDIQKIREYRFEKIASRYFTDKEQQYVCEFGSDAFFDIWVCKEAYAKYTGKGLGQYLRDICVLDNEDVEFTGIHIREDIRGVLCTKENKQIWIKEI